MFEHFKHKIKLVNTHALFLTNTHAGWVVPWCCFGCVLGVFGCVWCVFGAVLVLFLCALGVLWGVLWVFFGCFLGFYLVFGALLQSWTIDFEHFT